MKKRVVPEIVEDELEELEEPEAAAEIAETQQQFAVDETGVGQRLDQFLTMHVQDVSRARVQQLIEQDRVSIRGADGVRTMKASGKLRAGEVVTVTGEAAVAPLRAEAENIPLDIVYEDDFLAVINKPAGMMVHAGSGATDNARNRGTLVNALLHHMATLSANGGGLRPGIVHRLDKQTSGLIIVAKDDGTHRRLGEMFSQREMHKTYLTLVHGAVKQERGTIDAEINRDQQRRTRMTTRRAGGRTAISHYTVLERFESRYGHFTLLEVKIETGRTHQIRVHLSSIGHAVAGDTLYGAPQHILVHLESPATRLQKEAAAQETMTLERNFLHAARLEFVHPRSGKEMKLSAPLPDDLKEWLRQLTGKPDAGEITVAPLIKSKK